MKTKLGSSLVKKRESGIQGRFLTWVREKARATNGSVYVVKFPGGIFGENGTSDTILCCGGLFLTIEFKRSGEDPTKIQRYRMMQVRKSGGISRCCDSLEEAKREVMRVLAEAETILGAWR